MDVHVGFRIRSPRDATPSTGCVYVLKCPDTDAIRYVGSATNVMTRYTTHVSEGSRRMDGSKKGRWVASLLQCGKFPVLQVLSVLPVADLIAEEVRLYDSLLESGCDLTNSVRPAKNTKYGTRSKLLPEVSR